MNDLRHRVARFIRQDLDITEAALQQADQIIACVDADRDAKSEEQLTTRTMTQNDRGQWVPAIPLPLVTTFNKYKCTCRKKPFWTMEEYKQHWVYEHVYHGRPTHNE